MTGAIIPDDWDGSTFECQRIEWPASELWRAILLGQMSEPSREGYWDPETGDPAVAALAAQDAYRLTVPNIYSQECGDVASIPVPTFRAGKTVTQSIPAATWTDVTWQELEWDENTPQFSLAADGHVVANPDLFGLWHYSAIVNVLSSSSLILRAVRYPGPVSIAGLTASEAIVGISFDWIWEEAGETIGLQVMSAQASDIQILRPTCHWSGFFVGPTSE